MMMIFIQTAPTHDTTIAEAFNWLRANATNSYPIYTATAIDLVAMGEGTTSDVMTVSAYMMATTHPDRALRAGDRARGKAKPLAAKTLANYGGAALRVRRELRAVVGAPIIAPIAEVDRLVTLQKRPTYAGHAVAKEVEEAIEGFVASKNINRTHHFVEAGKPQTVAASRWSPATQRVAHAVLIRLPRIVSAAKGVIVGLAELLLPQTIIVALQRYESDGRAAEREAAAQPRGGGQVFGGHAFQEQLFMYLDMFVREYVRVRHADVYAKLIEAGTLEFYKAQRTVARRNAALADVRLKPDVSMLEPDHLIAFGQHFWRSYEAVTDRKGMNPGISGRRYRRAYMGAVFLAEAPIRMKNLVSLRIGTHLTLERNRWTLSVPAKELKNGGACAPGRPYVRRLSPQLSEIISRFVDEMKAEYGSDIFSKVTLFQSPHQGIAGPQIACSLGPDIARVVEKEYGFRFSPHRVRDVVATYLIKWGPQNKRDGFALAAAALGDNPKTVVAKYYAPSDEGLDEYTESLHHDAGETDDED